MTLLLSEEPPFEESVQLMMILSSSASGQTPLFLITEEGREGLQITPTSIGLSETTIKNNQIVIYIITSNLLHDPNTA